MVSTRNHPRAFPEPQLSPSKSSNASTPAPTADDSESTSSAVTTRTPGRQRKSAGAVRHTKAQSAPGTWSHTPSHLTLVWFAISLPLVIWDTVYVLGRPHTMPGGSIHWPLWVPYKLYGEVDHFYGWRGWDRSDGFTGAQGAMNALETVGYFVYLWLVWVKGSERDGEGVEGRGAPGGSVLGSWWREARVVDGGWAGITTMVGFATAWATLTKTMLYGLTQPFSGYSEIGHNDFRTLFLYWIFPNGSWIVASVYMTYVLGAELLEGLLIASGDVGFSAAREKLLNNKDS